MPGAGVRRVAGQLGVDLGRPGPPGGGQAAAAWPSAARNPGPARPRGCLPSSSRGQQVQLRRRGGGPARAAGPRRADGRCPARPPAAAPAAASASYSPAVGTQAGSASSFERRARPRPARSAAPPPTARPPWLPATIATNAGTAQLGLAHHVDERAPAHGARERVGQRADRRGQRRDRAVVEPHERVRQVIVVEQQQVGLRRRRRARARRSAARRYRPPPAGCASARPARGYRARSRCDADAAADALRALHLEGAERGCRVQLESRSQGVRPGGLAARPRTSPPGSCPSSFPGLPAGRRASRCPRHAPRSRRGSRRRSASRPSVAISCRSTDAPLA